MKNALTFLWILAAGFAPFLGGDEAVTLLDEATAVEICEIDGRPFADPGFRLLRLSPVVMTSFENPPPPKAIESAADFQVVKHFFREVNTKRSDLGSTGPQALFLVLYFAAAAGLLVSSAVFIFRLWKEWPMGRWLRPAVFAFPAAMFLFGALAGTEFIIDNATDGSLEIHLDGQLIGDLAPESYASFRLGGKEHTFKVRFDNHTLETATVSTAVPFGQALLRAYGARGTYVYNILGRNRYFHEKFYYSR